MHTLFIGMPVYNGAGFIAEALKSLMKQTYLNWKLVISDNASTDNTADICQTFTVVDERIHYIRQETNIGPFNNFRFLLELADSPYFMWAASDDVWGESYIDACITGLGLSDENGLAFTNMVNIDSYGRIIRIYPSFGRFVFSDRPSCIASFVLDPEYLGKANQIYGIYKLASLKRFMLDFLARPEANLSGADVAFNLGILCRTNLYIDERELFMKRIVRPTDNIEKIDWIKPIAPYITGMASQDLFSDIKKAMIVACEGTEYSTLVSAMIQYRDRLLWDSQITNHRFNNLFIKLIDYETSQNLKIFMKNLKRVVLKLMHIQG